MPNWCENTLIVGGPGTEQFASKCLLEQQSHTGFSFNALVPVPEEYSKDGRCVDWCIDHWGTKWEPELVNYRANHNYAEFYFLTAWTPPRFWLAEVAKQFPDLEFELYYSEPGIGIAGYIAARNGAIDKSIHVDNSEEPEKYTRFLREWFGEDPEDE